MTRPDPPAGLTRCVRCGRLTAAPMADGPWCVTCDAIEALRALRAALKLAGEGEP